MDYPNRGQAPLRSIPYKLSTRPLGLKLTHRRPTKRERLIILILNITIITVLIILLNSGCDALFYPSYASPPPHYQHLENVIQSLTETGRGNLNKEKIFIASNIINADLINGAWGESVRKLINYLGPNNVFLSIYENNSGQESINALRDFANSVACPHSIVYGDNLPLSTFPSVVLRNGEIRVKRLTYLEEVRNRLLWPLEDPTAHPHANKLLNFTSTNFDRILFINDVFFDPIEVLHLLFSTHYDPEKKRADYNAACAIDFFHPIQHYDEFVVRDSEGYIPGVPFFPWFNNQGSAESRKAVVGESDAVPVKSCWGGIVAFAATEFLRKDVVCPSSDKKSPSSANERCSSLSSTHHAQGPLRFRHQSETYWEAPECCLLHADLAHRLSSSSPSNPKTTVPNAKIYMNPYVRTTYSARSWSKHRLGQRFEKLFTNFNYFASWIFYTDANARRTFEAGDVVREVQWRFDDERLNGERMREERSAVDVSGLEIEGLKGAWREVEIVAKPGGFCGQRLALMMKSDLDEANREGRNWEKVVIPEGEPRQR